MFKFSKIIATLFYIGFFPYASGTISSLASMIFFYSMIDYISIKYTLIIFFITLIISVKCIDIYSVKIKKDDSSEIVVDEFLGIALIMIFYDFLKFSNDINMLIIIFILFRFFDIVKIFPANWIDKNIKNSWGVILDDLIAAIYTCITLLILNALI